MAIAYWEHEGACYRVFYQGQSDSLEGQNVLQRKSHREWQTIETENVPTYVRLAKSCFGDDGGWKSNLIAKTYTKYGRRRY